MRGDQEVQSRLEFERVVGDDTTPRLHLMTSPTTEETSMQFAQLPKTKLTTPAVEQVKARARTAAAERSRRFLGWPKEQVAPLAGVEQVSDEDRARMRAQRTAAYLAARPVWPTSLAPLPAPRLTKT